MVVGSFNPSKPFPTRKLASNISSRSMNDILLDIALWRIVLTLEIERRMLLPPWGVNVEEVAGRPLFDRAGRIFGGNRMMFVMEKVVDIVVALFGHEKVQLARCSLRNVWDELFFRSQRSKCH